ncbi:MAG: omptin family outer membrane protease [Candidatus Marinimicrobia bacterium]|nr:omptin family outer membrane protease [Candidatus Neomarinimicrobiota bacterium]
MPAKCLLCLFVIVSLLLPLSAQSQRLALDAPVPANAQATAVVAAPATLPPPPTARQFRVWSGLGMSAGDVTYQIGGNIKMGGESMRMHFPISELEFPMDVALVTLGAGLQLPSGWEWLGELGMNLSDPSSKMKDSDWTIPHAPRVKTIYSESDADLDAFTLDARGRRWFYRRQDASGMRWALGAGAGLYYAKYEWEAYNVDQWYPQEPWRAHFRHAGVGITYEATVLMPYVELAGQLERGPWHMTFSLGLSPYTQVEDVDDHVLRSIRAETDADGTGFKMEFDVRYAFSANWQAFGRLNLLGFSVDGTEKDHVYAGPDAGNRWEIDHEIESRQTQLVAGITRSW